MADFKKLFGLTFSAVCFAGMAYGQATCAYTAGSPTAVIVRAEGTTETLAPVSITCTVQTGSAVTGAGPDTITIQDFVSAPVTSKVLTAATGATEAVAQVFSGGVAFGAPVNGTIGGVNNATINFSGIPVPASVAVLGSYSIVISNVKVNASTIALGTGAPPPITEAVFITGGATVLNPASLAGANAGFAELGIGSKSFKDVAATKTGANSFVVCTAISPAGGSISNVVQINEGFQTAFKTAADEAPQVALAGNAVASGTRVKIAFSNVPSNVTLYVPVAVTAVAPNTAVLTLTASETGALSAVPGIAGTSTNGLSGPLSGTLAPVAVSGGSGVAVYEVTVSALTALDQFNVPVYLFATANTVSGSATAITESVSFAPVGSTNAPNFVVNTTSTTALTGSTFNVCTTSLMFPFVTNQLGFDTGLVVSNTSADPFGSTKGATQQAGTCTLNFYGAGAPTPANVATPSVAAGTTYAVQLSSVAAGFQGYIIAQCNFLFAHGFAFITDGVGPNGGLSQGYLAGVIPDTSQLNRGIVPTGGASVGEFLGN